MIFTSGHLEIFRIRYKGMTHGDTKNFGDTKHILSHALLKHKSMNNNDSSGGCILIKLDESFRGYNRSHHERKTMWILYIRNLALMYWLSGFVIANKNLFLKYIACFKQLKSLE